MQAKKLADENTNQLRLFESSRSHNEHEEYTEDTSGVMAGENYQ